jgi:formate/nitrite transporter FocA (FNT family)
MATAAKDIAGKVWAIFFPICAFVVGGWEHCVANMYYIPSGMLASMNSTYVSKAEELYGITTEQIAAHLNIGGFISNLIPVTIGNIIGGMVFVALPLYTINYKEKDKGQTEK